jgi:hypothetical protein
MRSGKAYTMNKHLHRVLGLYATRGAAEMARERLVAQGMQPGQLMLLQPGADGSRAEARATDDDLLYETLREGALGATIGLLAGLLLAAVLKLLDVGFFDADPLFGMRLFMGWGAAIGGFVGAAAGARRRKHTVADLLRISLAGGYIVLVANTVSHAQMSMAQLVLGESMRTPYGVPVRA